MISTPCAKCSSNCDNDQLHHTNGNNSATNSDNESIFTPIIGEMSPFRIKRSLLLWKFVGNIIAIILLFPLPLTPFDKFDHLGDI